MAENVCAKMEEYDFPDFVFLTEEDITVRDVRFGPLIEEPRSPLIDILDALDFERNSLVSHVTNEIDLALRSCVASYRDFPLDVEGFDYLDLVETDYLILEGLAEKMSAANFQDFLHNAKYCITQRGFILASIGFSTRSSQSYKGEENPKKSVMHNLSTINRICKEIDLKMTVIPKLIKKNTYWCCIK